MGERRESTPEVRQWSRRDFLRIMAAGAGGALGAELSPPLSGLLAHASGDGNDLGELGDVSQSPDNLTEIGEIDSEILGASNYEIRLGEEVRESQIELTHAPDGQISLIRDEQGSVMLMPAGVSTYRFTPGENGEFGEPIKVYGPQEREIEGRASDYAGITSVVVRGDEWFGSVHYEDHQPPGSRSAFTAYVGLVKSTDRGLTWEHVAVVNPGVNPNKEAGSRRVSGAGQPSMILDQEGRVQLFYIDWRADGNPDQIYKMVADLDEIENPDAWRVWDGADFSLAVGDPNALAVLRPPAREVYAALPQISWNEYLQEYLAVVETNGRFAIATSRDLNTWSDFTTLLEREAARFLSYPSLVSASGPNGDTGRYAKLHYAVAANSLSPHFVHTRTVEFLKESDEN